MMMDPGLEAGAGVALGFGGGDGDGDRFGDGDGSRPHAAASLLPVSLASALQEHCCVSKTHWEQRDGVSVRLTLGVRP